MGPSKVPTVKFSNALIRTYLNNFLAILGGFAAGFTAFETARREVICSSVGLAHVVVVVPSWSLFRWPLPPLRLSIMGIFGAELATGKVPGDRYGSVAHAAYGELGHATITGR